MAESVAPAGATSPGDEARASRARRVPRALAVPLLAVVGFWWAATGVLIAMQRDEWTRGLSLLASTALAAYGARLLVATRDQRTPMAACRAFAAGALLWAWVSTLFYGGWVTGLQPGAGAGGSAPSLALAVEAVGATIYADLLSLGLIGMAVLATWRARNQMSVWTLLLFWGAHQTAKLNVFFGVRHAGGEFLPRDLAFLERYFGPPANSLLLPVTVAALGVLTAVLAVRAWHARTPYLRAAYALLAVLATLAMVEHALLGVDVALPLWNVFLRARGT